MPELKGSPKLGEYLRCLRSGYGYSLRKVEEKARQQGGEIDNSQLSRYEKGVCYPSFDKLRTLARIFNVSVQTFSDVVDLEELEKNQPEGNDARELLREGNREWQLGDYGRAYVSFQKAIRILDEGQDLLDEETTRLVAKARLGSAIILYMMRKISMSEYEIRQLLRMESRLDDETKVRALLQLSNVHASFGDYMLAEMEARHSLDLAKKSEDETLIAFAHHALGRIFQDSGRPDEALEYWHQALEAYRKLGNAKEALKVKRSLGLLYADRGQFREGIRLLQDARAEARKLGHRWTVASAGACLAEVYYKKGSFQKARTFIRESNAIASNGEVQYVDILFLNAFYLWRIAQAEGNRAEAKIVFGRLKYLRPNMEQTLPEVREFDHFMEKGGAR